MAYYYYYQTPPDPLSPVPTTEELSTSQPSLLMLSSPSQQQQINLPLLTPILPSVTTSMSMMTTTTTTSTEHYEQQQLPTPNTFIRHCDDMGLFHDLQNIVVMSSLTGPTNDTTISTAPTSTAATVITTAASTGQPNSSNLFDSSSTAIVTTMMMANPFDETFKQAVLQQQKNEINLSENLFNHNNSNDGDLNTPFIPTTTAVNTSNNNTTVKTSTSLDMISTTTAAIESNKMNATTVPQSQAEPQQNVYITSTAEAPTRSVLVMMVENPQQQSHNSTLSIQPEHQQHQQIIDQHKFIVPTTTTTTSDIDTETITSHDQDFYEEEVDVENGHVIINVGNDSNTIKQALKQNLLVKQLLQRRQKSPLITENCDKLGQLLQQQNNDIGIVTNTDRLEHENYNSNDQEDENCNSRKQQLKQKRKQEMLERNRSAAKRCRIKRKQRWELLSEENRKLKIENSRLREALSKLVSHKCSNLQQPEIIQGIFKHNDDI
ncbi:anaphase-promoting complex subunit cdh1-like [Melanaphis sacchari]|uniref:anaphase-promoting complex subunit cdh1-like n=1 Tax=Melanaphis sacchari TaxID=742174 RepID=UPI000DC150C1|nr:anaphase-promoting complex subunit cdh1-like [Melanaphis sacchari]